MITPDSCRLGQVFATAAVRVLTALLIILQVQAPAQSQEPLPNTARVLFVGNSLTYVGNLPAVFSSLAGANGHAVQSDMMVRGGAALTERVRDGSVRKALEEHQYSALILQERGGDLLCAFGPDSCVESRQSVAALADLGAKHGLQVILLGTYQQDPNAALSLSFEEYDAAEAADIAYLDVSAELQGLLVSAPELAWFADDGMHPGEDLTLLMAILIHDALFGTLPQPKALSVDAPIYETSSGLTGELRRSGDAPPRQGTPMSIEYSKETMTRLVRSMAE